MTLRLVKGEDRGGSEGPGPPGEESHEQSTGPRRKTRRALALALIAVLLAAGGTALGMAVYVSRQAEGYELTLTFGPRTTHVIGTDVRLEEGAHETRCVLSLLDFRRVREESLFCSPPSRRPRSQVPTFTIAINGPEHSVVNSGPLPKEQLAPLDALVITRASACITQTPPR
ncbi:MAG: hypothetical protein IPJ65_09505 [Archangiaceae bacterium]|nr:hypothetical protein [Archangiaceae bacterium]